MPLSTKRRLLVGTLLLALPLGQLPGCTSAPTPEETAAPTPPAAPAATSPKAIAAPDCRLPIYQLSKLNPQPSRRLDTALVAGLVRQEPRLQRSFGQYSQYDDLFALDTVQCQGFRLVVWLHRHEDCCEELHYLTFAPGGQLLAIQQAAAQGADGEWRAESTMRRLPNQHVRTKTVAENAISPRDEQPDGSLLSYPSTDNVVKEFYLTAQGGITRILLDSTRRKH